MGLRLLFVAADTTGRGGAARSARRLIDGLRGRGHVVTEVVPDPHLFPGDVQVRGGRVACGAGAWRPAVAARVADADAVVGWYASLGGVVAHEAGATRLLVAVRGNDLDRDADSVERGPATRAALRHARVVTTNARQALPALGALGARARFIANGCDRSRMAPNPAGARALADRLGLDGRPVLGLFGELKPKRGLHRLAGWDLSGWQVLLVGHVRPSVAAHVPPGAHHVPTLHDEEALAAAYTLCRAVLQPSLADGMPNVLLEAMACERVVVGSPVGGIPDLIDPGVTGFLCDTDAAWQATLDRLRDAGPPPGMGARARAAVPTPAAEQAAFERALAEVAAR